MYVLSAPNSQGWKGCSQAGSQWVQLWLSPHSTWYLCGSPPVMQWCRRLFPWWSQTWHSPLHPLQSYSEPRCYRTKYKINFKLCNMKIYILTKTDNHDQLWNGVRSPTGRTSLAYLHRSWAKHCSADTTALAASCSGFSVFPLPIVCVCV